MVREWRRAGDEVIELNRSILDLTDLLQVRRTLEALDFRALVNCAALTNVDQCEREPAEAHRINSQAVATIGDVCSRKGARCVHISTDYVFDGTKNTPYTEEDEPRPISVYGESKWSGERSLHAIADRHLVVRVSWIFGPDRPSFVDQILRQAMEHDRVEAIADKYSVPTYALDAAHLLRPLVDDQGTDGTVHLCNSGACSWQEYGQHALDCAAAIGLPLRARKVEPLALADMKNFIARRPIYTPLDNSKLAALTGVTARPWQEAVEDYVRTHWGEDR